MAQPSVIELLRLAPHECLTKMQSGYLNRAAHNAPNGAPTMITRYMMICATVVAASAALHGTSAYALSMQECNSAKYKEANEAGTLNG